MTVKTGNNSFHTFPLALKLILSLLAIAAVMVAFLFGYFGPHTRESFLEQSDGLIALSRDALRGMAYKSTSDSKALLLSLIRHTADSRSRNLKDLPLSLYSGDVERIRRVVERNDRRKSDQHQANVEILASEMEQRSLKEVEARLENLTARQSSMGTAFAASMRQAYLILVGTVFSTLVVLLGFGLYRTVVFPLKELRRGTRAVTRGDLEITLPVRSNDEVGGLTSDFTGMVHQLRESREDIRKKNDELHELNRTLEDEVARKTEHLEKALHDLQRTQRQLIHAEKMASIGTLAGGVAHEFNNLIGGIRGCTADALDTEEDGDRREVLEVIMRAATRAGEITEQLLRFSRQRAMKMVPVDVTGTVQEALTLIEPEARKRKVHILRKMGDRTELLADGDALHQVFLNLYTNAVQAMAGGGELGVETEKTDRELVVRIKDTGGGIHPDHLDRIFEPFFTTKDQASDPGLRGSGLGLSVSYSIVEAHGGSIEVKSEPGEGTVFTVTLPLTEQNMVDG